MDVCVSQAFAYIVHCDTQEIPADAERCLGISCPIRERCCLCRGDLLGWFIYKQHSRICNNVRVTFITSNTFGTENVMVWFGKWPIFPRRVVRNRWAPMIVAKLRGELTGIYVTTVYEEEKRG